MLIMGAPAEREGMQSEPHGVAHAFIYLGSCYYLFPILSSTITVTSIMPYVLHMPICIFPLHVYDVVYLSVPLIVVFYVISCGLIGSLEN